MAISLNEINKITMQVLNKHYKAATEPGEPVAPKMEYKLNTLQSGFDVTDGGKTYFIPAEDLKYKNTSINAFWDDLSPEAKETYLVSNQSAQTPKTTYNSLMEALTKALPKQETLPFASLQEMYDSAKPTKLKKGAAKTVGTSAKKLTFGGNEDLQYKPLNLEIKNTTSLQDFKVDFTNIQGQIFVTNWAESQPKQPKKGK